MHNLNNLFFNFTSPLLSLSLNKTEKRKGRVTNRTGKKENNRRKERSSFKERNVKFLYTYLKFDPTFIFIFFLLFFSIWFLRKCNVEICNPKFIVVVFLCNFIYFVEICKLKFIIVFCTHLCLVFEKIKGKLQNSNP